MSNICLCNKVTKETIVLAVKNGAKTYEEVKEATGAGAGCCRGARCKGCLLYTSPSPRD